MTLESREKEVLTIIIQDYIDHAMPIGSRHVSKMSNLNLSPASMRNIMSDMTEKGYLMQPHTSAGRIPTDKGFRYYVDNILKPGLLTREIRKNIHGHLNQAGLEFSELLEQTSKLISIQASQWGMAVAPRMSFARWHQIEFVLIRPGLVTAILIFQGGIVQNKLIHVDENVTSDDLTKYSNYLNERFQGENLYKIKQKILQEIEEAQNEFQDLYSRAIKLLRDSFANQSEREIFVEGTVNVLEKLDSSDISSMKELLDLVEQRSNLLEILEKITNLEGSTISFGSEFYGPELGEWGLISSPYTVKGEPVGVVGTIGPINMNYSKLVPMVDYIAKMLTDICENRF